VGFESRIKVAFGPGTLQIRSRSRRTVNDHFAARMADVIGMCSERDGAFFRMAALQSNFHPHWVTHRLQQSPTSGTDSDALVQPIFEKIGEREVRIGPCGNQTEAGSERSWNRGQ
jgi:hypothetical protein